MNLGNSSVADLLAFGIGMTPAEFYEKAKDRFDFVLNYAAADFGAGDTASDAFTTRGDSWFVILGVNGVARNPAAANASIADHPIDVTMELDSGRDLQSAAADWDNVFGTGTLPGVWGAPRFLRNNTTLTCTLTNNTAIALDASLSFWGFKIFDTAMGE